MNRQRSSHDRRQLARLAVECLENRNVLSSLSLGSASISLPQPVLAASLARAALLSPARSVVVSVAHRDRLGFLVHQVRSPYQAGVTEIRVLMPSIVTAGTAYPVVYLLPVEAGRQTVFGDGLLEAKRDNLHNRFQAILVAPTFAQLPWYADHPTRPDIRQESYFLKVVVPFIDAHYPTRAEARGRLLAGFSKSGWGAFSLLLRHPDIFGKAAAWDAPLMMAAPSDFGMGPIFGTQQNFENYRIIRLLRQHAGQLQTGQRLVLLGYSGFRAHHQQTHELMRQLGISHVYRDGPPRPHYWQSGWLRTAVQLVLTG